MTTLGWGVARPTNRPGKPGGAASNLTRIRRALARFSGIDVDLLGTVVATADHWVKVTKTYADFSAAATTKTITAYTLPAAAVLNKVVLATDANFTGGALGTYTVTPVASADILTRDVFSTAGLYTFANETNGLLGQPYDLVNTYAIQLRADSTGANLSAATQGSLRFWINFSVLP